MPPQLDTFKTNDHDDRDDVPSIRNRYYITNEKTPYLFKERSIVTEPAATLSSS